MEGKKADGRELATASPIELLTSKRDKCRTAEHGHGSMFISVSLSATQELANTMSILSRPVKPSVNPRDGNAKGGG